MTDANLPLSSDRPNSREPRPMSIQMAPVKQEDHTIYSASFPLPTGKQPLSAQMSSPNDLPPVNMRSPFLKNKSLFRPSVSQYLKDTSLSPHQPYPSPSIQNDIDHSILLFNGQDKHNKQPQYKYKPSIMQRSSLRIWQFPCLQAQDRGYSSIDNSMISTIMSEERDANVFLAYSALLLAYLISEITADQYNHISQYIVIAVLFVSLSCSFILMKRKQHRYLHIAHMISCLILTLVNASWLYRAQPSISPRFFFSGALLFRVQSYISQHVCPISRLSLLICSSILSSIAVYTNDDINQVGISYDCILQIMFFVLTLIFSEISMLRNLHSYLVSFDALKKYYFLSVCSRQGRGNVVEIAVNSEKGCEFKVMSGTEEMCNDLGLSSPTSQNLFQNLKIKEPVKIFPSSLISFQQSSGQHYHTDDGTLKTREDFIKHQMTSITQSNLMVNAVKYKQVNLTHSKQFIEQKILSKHSEKKSKFKNDQQSAAIPQTIEEQPIETEENRLNSANSQVTSYKSLEDVINDPQAEFVQVIGELQSGKDTKFLSITLLKYLNLLGKQVVIASITDQTATRENQRLELELKFKEKMFANVTHDLRTPLYAIMYSADQLKDIFDISRHPTLLAQRQHLSENVRGLSEDKISDLHDQINITIANSHLMKAVIQDIIDNNRNRMGKLVVELQWFDLMTTLEEMRKLTEIILWEKRKEIKIRFDIGKNIQENPQVFSDSQRLKQVLMNLISNAIKFTKKGGILVRVERVMFPQISNQVNMKHFNEHALSQVGEQERDHIKNYMLQNGLIKIQVIDSGIGMSKQTLQSLFKPFSTFNHDNMNSHGIGLGLTIAQSIVEKIGPFHLKVASQEKRGSKFTFYIFQNPVPSLSEMPKTERAFITPQNKSTNDINEEQQPNLSQHSNSNHRNNNKLNPLTPPVFFNFNNVNVADEDFKQLSNGVEAQTQYFQPNPNQMLSSVPRKNDGTQFLKQKEISSLTQQLEGSPPANMLRSRRQSPSHGVNPFNLPDHVISLKKLHTPEFMGDISSLKLNKSSPNFIATVDDLPQQQQSRSAINSSYYQSQQLVTLPPTYGFRTLTTCNQMNLNYENNHDKKEDTNSIDLEIQNNVSISKSMRIPTNQLISNTYPTQISETMPRSQSAAMKQNNWRLRYNSSYFVSQQTFNESSPKRQSSCNIRCINEESLLDDEDFQSILLAPLEAEESKKLPDIPLFHLDVVEEKQKYTETETDEQEAMVRVSEENKRIFVRPVGYQNHLTSLKMSESMQLNAQKRLKYGQSSIYESERQVLHVLICDDSTFSVDALKRLLLLNKSFKMNIDTCLKGEDAIDKFQIHNHPQSTNQYQYIFLDWNMPIMDGYETSSKIKFLVKDEQFLDCPIIICSAYDDDAEINKCLRYGTDGVLTKPVSLNRLNDLIEGFKKNSQPRSMFLTAAIDQNQTSSVFQLQQQL